MSKQKRIILGVTGSIAAYKAADIIRELQSRGIGVSVVMTEEAKRFIAPLTLSSLAKENVVEGIFDNKTGFLIPHIELARNADILLIAPATANIIAKLACGIADDLLTCIAITVKSPILIAPAMNVNMYKNSIVQENFLKLKKHGIQLIVPVKKKLACGEVAEGHIADTADIVRDVIKNIK